MRATEAKRVCPQTFRWASWLLRPRQQPYRLLVTIMTMCFVYLQFKVLVKFSFRAFHDPCSDDRYGLLYPYQERALNQSVKTFQSEKYSDLTAVFQPRQQGYLVIGVVATGLSAFSKDNKLSKTVSSIISSSTAEERKYLNIVIFLASFDNNVNQEMFDTLRQNYSSHIRSGLIQTVHLNRRRIHNSPTNSWLTTHRIMATIYFYIHELNQGERYIHLREGMHTSYNFISHVKQFVDHYESLKPRVNMVIGHLSDDDLFGTVYSVKDLEALSQYLTLFPSEQPMYKTLELFMQSKAQYKKYKYHRNLFSSTSKPVIHLVTCLIFSLIADRVISVLLF